MDREEKIREYNVTHLSAEGMQKMRQRGWVGKFPNLGEKGADFPLWKMPETGTELEQPTSLMSIVEQNKLTIVKFGSFT